MSKVLVRRCKHCDRYDSAKCPICGDSHTHIIGDKLICIGCGRESEIEWDYNE